MSKSFEILGGKVTVTQGTDGWRACITGESACWELGKTSAEAVGNLIVTHEERFRVLDEHAKLLPQSSKTYHEEKDSRP